METVEGKAPQHPFAELKSIRLGLLTTQDVRQISVYSKKGDAVRWQSELTDSRLGLPNADRECKSCGKKFGQDCEGHFGHIVLPTPIYHPNYVPDIVRILNRICLKCFELKKKGKKKQGAMSEKIKEEYTPLRPDYPGTMWIEKHDDDGEDVPAESIWKDILQSRWPQSHSSIKKDRADVKKTILLNGDACTKGCSMSSPVCSHKSRRFRPRSCKASPATKTIIDVSDDDDISLSERHGNIAVKCELSGTSDGQSNPGGKHVHSKKHERFISKEPQATSSHVKRKHGDASQVAKSKCQYCKGSYPKVQVKIERKCLRKDEQVEEICLEIDSKAEFIPHDYWKILGDFVNESTTKTQILCPSDALDILRRIPDRVVKNLGMNSSLARPEALVLECLLIPPNCNRIPETIGLETLRPGSDRVTQMLRKILRKIDVFKSSSGAKISMARSKDELQSLFAQYLRIKGAPKVRGNKEPNIDHVGRSQDGKEQSGTFSAKKLQDRVAAKRSSYCGRAVLTGDPFLSLDEIGIPLEIAKGLTIKETVTNFNMEKIQEILKNGPNSSRKVGALQLFKQGVKFDLRSQKEDDEVLVEPGDAVERHLQDGDHIFCNRQPSIHKHSVLGLHVKIIERHTLAINPLICPPLGADFDGDCLHVFVPQSIESKAELKILLDVERQMLMSQGGQAAFVLTQDALLAAHQLTSRHVFINKEVMNQSIMWMSAVLPIPAIVSSPKGPFWTGFQLMQISLPPGIDYTKHGVQISKSELLVTSCQSEWLKNTVDGIVPAMIEQCGPAVTLQQLDGAQKMLVTWLSNTGFSVGLDDVFGTCSTITRIGMKQELMSNIDIVKKAVQNQVEVWSSTLNQRQMQTDLYTDGESYSTNDESFPEGYRLAESSLTETTAIEVFQDSISDVENALLKYVGNNNTLLEMVKAGSKGSKRKVIQQFGFLGFHNCKNEGFHDLKHQENIGSALYQSLMSSTKYDNDQETWQKAGFIGSSFVEGLNSHEFFVHAVSSRDILIRQGLELKEPGGLFKNVMLFMRDIHIAYDGTVRSRYGQNIIQFCYGGTKADADDKEGQSSMLEGKVCAGEPVGVLAATAIVQPTYESLLESQQRRKSAVNPLDIMQETLYSRRNSALKTSDRRVVLYFSGDHCKEAAALAIQRSFTNCTLGTLSSVSWMEYEADFNCKNWQGMPSTKKSPLIGHILLNTQALHRRNISSETVLAKLKNVKDDIISRVGPIFYSWSNECQCASSDADLKGPCIHYAVSPLQGYYYDEYLKESFVRMRDEVLPYLLEQHIMGDSKIDSAVITWKDAHSASWTPIQGQSGLEAKGDIAMDVKIKESQVKTRHDAWVVVNELCQPLAHLIDWSRSMPDGIQGVCQILGIEAARMCILQRLKSTIKMFDKPIYMQHIDLVADVMTHTGNVVGFNAAGFREFVSDLQLSAPFTQAIFQNPIKIFELAALKGRDENLDGAVPSICWGKRAPVGTGGDFEIFWRELQVHAGSTVY